MKTKESFATGCLVVLGWFLFAFLSTAWSGYVLSILWGWFVVPLFKATALSIAQAVGLATTIRLITTTHITKRDDSKLGESIAYGVLVPSFFLLFGWLAKQFL